MKSALPRTLTPLRVLFVCLCCWFFPATAPLHAADPEGEAPEWAKQPVPDFVKPFLGRHGLSGDWLKPPGPLSMNVAGLDRWQANHFIVYRKETAEFLNSKYTPTKVDYVKGTFPSLEKIVAEFTTPAQTDREKAVALLTKAMPKYLLHPTVPPKRPYVRPNRALDDEALMASGCAWCNEQARVYVRLCQIAGVPARMIFLFYANEHDGHTASEFYADGHWCMSDSSYFCVFPDQHGRLLSAAELHTPGHKPLVARAYLGHCEEILKLSDDQLAPKDGDKARKAIAGWKGKLEKVASGELLDTHGPEDLGTFGVLDYPLPTSRPVPPAVSTSTADGAKPAADGAKPAAGKNPKRLKKLKKPKKPHIVPTATVAVATPSGESLLELDLSGCANDHFSAPFGESRIESDGIEFRLPSGPKNQVNLRPAEWLEWKHDGVPWSTEGYDVGLGAAGDPRNPRLRVPCMDYIAAHVLAVADDYPNLTSTLTLRPRTNNQRLALQWDFTAVVPRRSQLAALGEKQVVTTPAGRLAHVIVPLGAISQDISIPPRLADLMEIDLTKEVRVAVFAPLACRWRYRPLGSPSGVRIAAITLEKAPLQMRVSSKETGHAFVQPGKPVFQVRLQNITDKLQPYKLVARARHLDGTTAESQTTGSVAAGQTAEVSLEVPVPKRGYYTLDMALSANGGRELVRRTSFALLPPDTRKHRDESPFGTYDYGKTTYGVPINNEALVPLYVKMGMRYAMCFSAETCRKFGLLHGLEPNISNGKPGKGTEAWRKAIAKDPNYPPYVITYHEAGVSGDHMTRVPDIFVDRPYQVSEKEQERMKNMREKSIANFEAMRKEYPQVNIALVNGPIPTLEAFLPYHFPAELFGSAGNEAGSYNRPPETQPPDWVANNASLWMERQMLDAYGYKDKKLTQCHEICYPDTNPGDLSLTTQADYFVRHAMHSLAWGIPQIRMGIIADVGASYYYSNWGASGYCNCYPELNVKPSFVAMATLTWVLDGAKFRKVVDLGSPSLYGIAFDRPDGQHVLVLWTIRGHRPVTLKFKPAAGATFNLVDDQANETTLPVKDGAVEVTLSPTPVYLVMQAEFDGAQAGAPRYDEKPAAKATVLSDLSSLDEWTLEKGHNALLEYYNFLEPRRLGDFTFQPVKEFEGRNNVLQVTPRPIKEVRETIAMPMYAVLTHNKGIPVPGTPTEIGLWVNGNSSWGRVIYELADASGQRWVSIGNPLKPTKKKPYTPFDDSVIPDTHVSKRATPIDDWCDNDSFGWSRIDFDGWRYVAFPAPGQYPGEGYHWPGNIQWFHDKDGVVHYPLTFKKLIIQLPAKTLHMRDFAPAPRKEIYLKDLTAGQDDLRTYMLKTTSDARPR